MPDLDARSFSPFISDLILDDLILLNSMYWLVEAEPSYE